MKLMARFLLNNIWLWKGFMPTATKYQGIPAEGSGVDVMAQYTKKVLTFIIIPAKFEDYLQFIQEPDQCPDLDDEPCPHPEQQRNHFVYYASKIRLCSFASDDCAH
jgi:hypothetical protein